MKVNSKFEISLGVIDILIIIFILILIISPTVYLLTIYKHNFYCELPSDFEFNHTISNVRDFSFSYECVFKSLLKDRTINNTIGLRITDIQNTQSQAEFYKP